MGPEDYLETWEEGYRLGQYKCQEQKLKLEHPKVEWSARKHTWQEIDNQCEVDYLGT